MGFSKRAALCALFLALALLEACEKQPETYAPPVQRQTFENFRPYRISRMVDMSDGDVDSHIVRDIPINATGAWRWAGKDPEVKVTLRKTENLIYSIDFAVAEATLKDTGPVTFTFSVNDHVIGSKRYAAPGIFHFEAPIPQDWVEAGKDATVGASIDKIWVSPLDGVRLGFILTRIGVKQGA